MNNTLKYGHSEVSSEMKLHTHTDYINTIAQTSEEYSSISSLIISPLKTVSVSSRITVKGHVTK